LLPGLPALSGPQGVARQRARATGRTPEQAESEAAALTRILGLGRVLAAPPGLPESLAACLSSRLIEVLRSAELFEATQVAGLRIEPGDRDAMRNELKTAARELQQFEPLIRAAFEQARQ
jgi:hypothetical protein